jgi:hypothetical protein
VYTRVGSGTKKIVTVTAIKLRKIHQPERGEVTGDWRKLHNEELHCLNFPGDQIMKD